MTTIPRGLFCIKLKKIVKAHIAQYFRSNQSSISQLEITTCVRFKRIFKVLLPDQSVRVVPYPLSIQVEVQLEFITKKHCYETIIPPSSFTVHF